MCPKFNEHPTANSGTTSSIQHKKHKTHHPIIAHAEFYSTFAKRHIHTCIHSTRKCIDFLSVTQTTWSYIWYKTKTQTHTHLKSIDKPFFIHLMFIHHKENAAVFYFGVMDIIGVLHMWFAVCWADHNRFTLHIRCVRHRSI